MLRTISKLKVQVIHALLIVALTLAWVPASGPVMAQNNDPVVGYTAQVERRAALAAAPVSHPSVSFGLMSVHRGRNGAVARPSARAFMREVHALPHGRATAPAVRLARQPYNFWLQKLNSFGGDFRKAEMVKAFITSIEYRRRFGSP